MFAEPPMEPTQNCDKHMQKLFELFGLIHIHCIHGHLCGLVAILTTDPEVRVLFRALPDFLSSRGSGTGSTQPREYN
jgi:hypothetical protein